MQPIRDLDTLLSRMDPVLHSGRYAFVTLPSNLSGTPTSTIATIVEPEGLSAIVAEREAVEMGLPVAFTAAWITLAVQSDLAAAGLTAGFAKAMAQAGISCNVVAGVHHDHLFVPVELAQQAMAVLHALQQAAAPDRRPRQGET
ncbi:MAG: ACT domain-containing protein [Rhodanobacter sp.]